VDAAKGENQARPPLEGRRCLSTTAIGVLIPAGDCPSQYQSYYERLAYRTPKRIHGLQRLLGVEETGVLDGETRAAIKDQQARHVRPVTGVIDRDFETLFTVD
jgi:peptidoglycan hydrolase-like protein with peptidoglycan-binding domain